MPTILVAGSGQIGTAIGQILSATRDGLLRHSCGCESNTATQQLLLHSGLRYVPLNVTGFCQDGRSREAVSGAGQSFQVCLIF